MHFKFKRPVNISDLSEKSNFVIALAAIGERLAHEERLHVDHGSGRPENVAEHSLTLVKVSVYLADKYYPHLDKGKIAIYAASHDDVEAYVGDTPTDSVSNADLGAKEELEQDGLKQLIYEYKSISSAYTATVKAYEEQKEPEARFVRMVDKVVVYANAFFNDAKVFRDVYEYKQFVAFEIERANTWADQYPEFADIIAIRTEITFYLARKYLLDSPASA